MSVIGTLKTFATLQTPIPSAHFNDNFADIKTAVNSIDENNLSGTAKILRTDTAQPITGVKTFTANPVFNSAAIADASLSTNVVLKTGSQTITGAKTFDLAVEDLKLPIKSVHPTLIADNNSVYELSSDGQAYIYQHGTGAVRLDQIPGAYSGGAPNTYCGTALLA